MKSKGHLLNKNLSFVISGTGVSSLPETWKISQNVKFCMIMRSFGQLYSLYVTVWQQAPEHFFLTWAKNLRLAKSLVVHQKKMVVEFFSGSDETLKVANNLWFRFCWLIIFSAVRSHQQPMHGCILESSRLSNFFIGKDFIVQIFRKWRKNLPKTKRFYTEGASTLFFIMDSQIFCKS